MKLIFFLSLISLNWGLPQINFTENLIDKLQQYIQFDTVSKFHKYEKAVQWLKAYAKEVGLHTQIIACNPDKPIVIGTWHGSEESLPSILLNSHYDVVPVTREMWNTDPFSGELGNYNGEQVVYGRGSQDDKSLTIMYLEALRMLKKGFFRPRRTIHLTVVPDEEINGDEGMGCLINHQVFKSLNVGATLDEGFPSPDNLFHLFYGERASWGLNVTANGDTGHASKFINNLAINKLNQFINRAEAFRQEQELLSHFVDLGETTTMNLVMMGGGTAGNVVPDTLWAKYSIRVSPVFGTRNLRKMIKRWAHESNVTVKYNNAAEPTISPNDPDATVFNKILEVSKNLGHEIDSQIFPAATDSRRLRELGIPSYGLTPCVNVETRAHDHNEFLPVRCLQDGLLFYVQLLPELTSLDHL